jgi:hypothetical protein
VLGRFEVTEPLDEGGKGPLDRCVNDDLVPNDVIIRQVHEVSSDG